MITNPWRGSESYSPQKSFMADVQRCCCLCLENTSLWRLGVWPTCSLLHFTLAFGGLAYLFFQSLRHLENLAYLSFHKKKASASPASPASVPSLVLRATGTSSCGLGWGGSQLRVPRGRCSKLGLDGVRVVYMMRVARLVCRAPC